MIATSPPPACPPPMTTAPQRLGATQADQPSDFGPLLARELDMPAGQTVTQIAGEKQVPENASASPNLPILAQAPPTQLGPIKTIVRMPCAPLVNPATALASPARLTDVRAGDADQLESGGDDAESSDDGARLTDDDGTADSATVLPDIGSLSQQTARPLMHGALVRNADPSEGRSEGSHDPMLAASMAAVRGADKDLSRSLPPSQSAHGLAATPVDDAVSSIAAETDLMGSAPDMSPALSGDVAQMLGIDASLWGRAVRTAADHQLIQQQSALAAPAAALIDMTSDDVWINRVASDIASLATPTDALHFRLHPANLGMMRVALLQQADETHLLLRVETIAAQQMLTDARRQLLDIAVGKGVDIGDVRIELAGGGNGNGDTGSSQRQQPESGGFQASRRHTATDHPNHSTSVIAPIASSGSGSTYRFA